MTALECVTLSSSLELLSSPFKTAIKSSAGSGPILNITCQDNMSSTKSEIEDSYKLGRNYVASGR